MIEERVAEQDAAAAAPKTTEPDYVVALPFNSEYRRHVVDDPITRADLEKSHLDFDHLVESGFIVQKVESRKSELMPDEAARNMPETALKDVHKQDKEPIR